MKEPHDPSIQRRALLHGVVATTTVVAGSCALPDPPGSRAGSPAEVSVLNALLASEYVLLKTYGFARALLMSPPMGDPQVALSAIFVAIFDDWAVHHRTHARSLATLVASLGGEPVREETTTFVPPTGFSASIANALRLACNSERDYADACCRALVVLRGAAGRRVVTNIAGTDAQHFVVLYAVLKSVLTLNPAGIITQVHEVVPRVFVSSEGGTMDGLDSLPDLTYGST